MNGKSTTAAQLMRLSVPILVAGIANTAISVVDTIFVGQVSSQTLAGVAVGSFALYISIAFAYGFFQVTSIAVSHATGASDQELLARSLGAALSLLVPAVALTALLGLGFHQFLPKFTHSVEAHAAASDYFLIRMIAAPVLFAVVILRGFRYGIGDTAWPLAVTFAASLVNVPLDYLFIVHYDWGAAGAAWASNIALLAMLVGLCILQSTFGPLPRLPNRTILRNLIRLGLPLGIEEVAGKLGWVIVGASVASLGDKESAAHFAIVMLFAFVMCWTYAVKPSVQVLVGQHVSRSDFASVPEINRKGALLSILGTLLACVPIFIGSHTAVELFSDDSAVHVIMLRLVGLATIVALLESSYRCLEGTLLGAGDTKAAALFNTLTNLTVTPLAVLLFVFVLDYGVYGAWYASMAAHGASLLYVSIRVARSHWVAKAREALRQMRRHTRFESNLSGEFLSPEKVIGTIVNISRGGAAISLPDTHTFAVGDEFQLRIENIGEVTGRVARFSAAEEGKVVMGAVFLAASQPERFRRYLRRLSQRDTMRLLRNSVNS